MELARDVRSLWQKTLATLDTPVSLRVAILIGHGEWDQLTELTVDPLNYLDSPWGAEAYLRDAQAVALVKKYPGMPTSFDTKEVAVQNFWKCEKQCKNTNDRLDRYLESCVLRDPFEVEVAARIARARRFIARVLGAMPGFLDGKFGPGSVFESNTWRCQIGLTAYHKLALSPTCTPGAEYLVDHLVWQTIFGKSWGDALPNRVVPHVRGNRFATVPKDASKDRGIAIEPGLNVLGQLAVGKAIRNRLRTRAGINLDTGQSLHRQLACQGSRTGDYVTIDLSNASDTVARKLVQLLLPDDWYDLLSTLRSPFTFIGDRWVLLEKFSSMGNGFTFELETLIFCALAHASHCQVGADTFVYGDDIVMPPGRAEDFLALMEYMGFTPNVQKTHLSGAFRESCGGDFMMGQDVRPVFIKKEPVTPLDWMGLHNKFARKRRAGFNPWRSGEMFCWNRAPRSVRKCQCPPELGDIGFHTVRPPSRVTNCIRYYRTIRILPRLVKPSRYGPNVVLASAILGYSSEGIAPRDATEGWTECWVPYS